MNHITLRFAQNSTSYKSYLVNSTNYNSFRNINNFKRENWSVSNIYCIKRNPEVDQYSQSSKEDIFIAWVVFLFPIISPNDWWKTGMIDKYDLHWIKYLLCNLPGVVILIWGGSAMRSLGVRMVPWVWFYSMKHILVGAKSSDTNAGNTVMAK